MFKAGIPANIIIAKIKHAATNFDTTPKALIALKAARVPDTVIMAMVNAVPVRTVKPSSKPCGPAAAGMVPCPGGTSSPKGTKPSAPFSPPPVGPLPQISVPNAHRGTNSSAAGEQSLGSHNAEDQDAWQPEFDMDGQLYPSMVLELAGSSSRFGSHSPPDYIGDPVGMAGVKVFCSKDDESVHVSVRIDGLSAESTIDATLPHLGTNYYIVGAS